MATAESVTAAVDQVIAFFNARRMDLPDGFFDRRTQFVINGQPFETLLGQNPADPLILMLSRGPAGFRFTAKALQHAVPDAKLDRGDVTIAGDAASLELRLTGTLRGTGEPVDATVAVTLRFNAGRQVEVASADVDPATLEKIALARRT